MGKELDKPVGEEEEGINGQTTREVDGNLVLAINALLLLLLSSTRCGAFKTRNLKTNILYDDPTTDLGAREIRRTPFPRKRGVKIPQKAGKQCFRHRE